MVVIAHRIDTIMDLDRLLVLSGGLLVEQGNPRELAAGQGPFGRLVGAAREALQRLELEAAQRAGAALEG